MIKQLPKKIYAFIIIMMFSFSVANAQIVYTDENPDYVVNCSGSPCGASYSIDLNNDGTNDFTVSKGFNAMGSCAVTYYRTFSISPLTGNGVVKSSANIYPSELNSNDIISSSTSMTTSGLLRSSHQSYNCMNGQWGIAVISGNWSGTGYAGLKLVKSGITYYGWIRLSISMPSSSSLCSSTIVEFAYNSIPNQPIHPGETNCTLPTVSLAVAGSLSFCAGDSVTFTANGTGYQYQWKKNNINISGATAKTYVAKTAGVYKCKVTNSCGSKTSGTRTVTVPCRMTNENIVETLEHLSVYPNPATNSVTIKFPSDEVGEIQIVNLFGQVVYSAKVNSGQTQIDVSRFSAGVYEVKWTSGENVEMKRFSVIK